MQVPSWGMHISLTSPWGLALPAEVSLPLSEIRVISKRPRSHFLPIATVSLAAPGLPSSWRYGRRCERRSSHRSSTGHVHRARTQVELGRDVPLLQPRRGPAKWCLFLYRQGPRWRQRQGISAGSTWSFPSCARPPAGSLRRTLRSSTAAPAEGWCGGDRSRFHRDGCRHASPGLCVDGLGSSSLAFS